MSKIGIFGGSFDPIHWGHLLIAEAFQERFALDTVLLVPAFDPPHKTVTASFQDRCNMVGLAIQDNSVFQLCPIEQDLPTPSYATNTLAYLEHLYPLTPFYFLIGEDSYYQLETWYQYRKLFRQAELVVALRSCQRAFQPYRHLPALDLSLRYYDFSSSEIRDRVQASRSIRYMTPVDVQNYIEKEQLYQNNETS